MPPYQLGPLSRSGRPSRRVHRIYYLWVVRSAQPCSRSVTLGDRGRLPLTMNTRPSFTRLSLQIAADATGSSWAK